MSSDGTSRTYKKLRTLFGVCVLLALVLMVIGWWADFRGSVARDGGEESTDSADVEKTTPEGQVASNDAEGGGQPQTITVLVEGLNFRVAPSSGSQRIRRLSLGDELKYLGSNNGWYRVEDSEGTTGYVSSNKEYTKIQQGEP